MEKTEQKGIIERVINWFRDLTIKGLLSAILIAFIIIIIISSASYIPAVMNRISSSLSAALYSVFVPAENATITTDKKIINSGEDFTVTFNKSDTTNGILNISYACDSDISLMSVESNGLKNIACDAPFYILDNNTSLKIRPTTQSEVFRLVINGGVENNDTQEIEKIGVARITIKNNSVAVVSTPTSTAPVSSQPNTQTHTQSIYTAPSVSPTYYGKADLSVRVLQVGLFNNGTNFITNQSQFMYSDMVGVKFEVRNDGDAATGIWSFTASLPSISTPTYNSNTQISLNPGESIIFTLGFSNLTSQNTSLITINVDPQNTVSESIEYNNITTSTITNLSYNNSNYYNYNNSNAGCYVNGVYSYNCNNNYYNNGWNNNNYNNTNGYYDAYGNYISYNNIYNNLSVTCYSDPSYGYTGHRVRWYATAYGGNGNYTYDWSGSDSFNSTSQNPSKTYNTIGLKYASVTVSSNGYSVTKTCSVYVN